MMKTLTRGCRGASNRWRRLWAVLLPVVLGGIVMAAPAPGAAGAGVRLRSRTVAFEESHPVRSTLTVQEPRAGFMVSDSESNSFSVRFTVDLKPFEAERVLLEIPEVLQVRLRQHDPKDRTRQNYPAYKLPEGTVPVLEGTLRLRSVEHPDWTNMTVGIPLGLLERPWGEHEVVLRFTGPECTLYVDGEGLDNDFPFGYPRWSGTNTWRIDPACVRQAALYVPGLRAESRPPGTPPPVPGIQYWTPPGHNCWVGDVETIYFQGRYHVFYLYDRRHHASKFGCGAHYFEHLSTADFKSWTEHEAATPLEEQWECIGTGVPFALQGRLHLAYGLHTTRVYPQERTALPAQWDYLKQHGRSGLFPRATTLGVPAGSTYAVSDDGVAGFRKSWVLFHPCENPSVYVDPAGRLRLLANYRSRGTWGSEALDGGWRCLDPEFPPGGDCTICFRWGQFDYVLGGFTGLWSKPAAAPDTAYEDMVRKGLDFYDGSNVPAVSEIPGGRFLMAAWLPIHGWGGPLVIRELIQHPDGRIGSKWMREITPATGEPRTLAERLAGTAELPAASRSFLLTFEVQPSASREDRLAVSFLPGSGEQAGCEFQLRLADGRAQFAPAVAGAFATVEKSLREGGAPQGAGNYAIENLPGVERPFTVRVLVKGDDKLGGSLIDTEIAGQRTMISYRPELTVRRLGIRTEGVALRAVRWSPLAEEARPLDARGGKQARGSAIHPSPGTRRTLVSIRGEGAK